MQNVYLYIYISFQLQHLCKSFTERFSKTNICDLYFIIPSSDILLMHLLCCKVLVIKKLIKILAQILRIQSSFIASSLLNSNS